MQKTVILLISIITFISCHATGSDTNYSEQCKSTTATQHSPIVSPEIPQSIEFADTTIEFNRSDLRERIDRELISFSYMHTTSLLIMKRANRWLPEIESILKSEGIPDDFKYLMLIESNCDPLAQSYVGAGGLWQFMPATAKEFSLEVNSSIDERYNVELATHAACKYLRSAYRRFGNWFSVAASYNAGQGRIDSELNKQHADCALDLHLVSETSRYVFRILAAKIILENPDRKSVV